MFPCLLLVAKGRESALYPRPEETGLYGAAGKTDRLIHRSLHVRGLTKHHFTDQHNVSVMMAGVKNVRQQDPYN
jgi:hypothetical protein